jgi:hypothetical protein
MGNTVSLVEDLVKQIEASTPSPSALETLTRFTQCVPYWQPEQEGRQRMLHDFTSLKLLPNTLAQLAHELAAVNIAAREYSYSSASVGVVLHCIDLLLSSKAVYKQLPKQALGCVSLALQASVRRGDDATALQAANAVRSIIERVGFRERKTGKEQNQVTREADAKTRFIADGGLIEALLDGFAFLHARSNPLVADALVRLAVSLLCSRQDTTPYTAVVALHAGLTSKVMLSSQLSFQSASFMHLCCVMFSQHLPLIFELSRHAYPRLRVSACGLLKGLFLEGDAASALALQVRDDGR